jgi:hypothetical protein
MEPIFTVAFVVATAVGCILVIAGVVSILGARLSHVAS